MELIADLHLHSKYARAVSPQMIVSEISKWAIKKGIDLVGTGDWTHPLWLKELQTNLTEVAPGIFKPKPLRSSNQLTKEGVRFLLSTEISSIYSQAGKLRRIHNLVFAPSFTAVEKINEALSKRGANLLSDGRPIIGLSARDLAELVFTVDQNCLIIPAHVWTPWFSLYGSKSGFDSINECFGEMAKNIYAIETGLSSDPGMNWRIKELENRSIVSFSDAHSAAKLGREATVFVFREEEISNFSYAELAKAIKQEDNSKLKIAYTVEFYPEEGKYHFTGHRNCQVKQTPEETKRLGETCPVCGKRLTVGVMHRVEKLASFSEQNLSQEKSDENGVRWIKNEGKPPYVMLVPLLEIIAESLETSVASQKVMAEFDKLIANFGSEFKVLLKTPLEQIRKLSGERTAEAIRKVREGSIVIDPGYDGVFGTVKIWGGSKDPVKEEKENNKQMTIF